ncbi:hypothetical protein CPLU01_10983 [Colletotrichum plurivorum]|uniref:Uncharacterized protein n=1 Tax=Colletotrichum plurivorum TaxID=2175906 RepID=A0A8H6K3J8_9PEZI|nr:hypothetical protein CPLU01_10983 [Colletotrichum plurivorum]
MKFTTVVALFASTAAAIDWLPVVPLHARQEVTGPRRECHEDCGYTIRGARMEDYCTNSTWTDLFEGCLECANEFDIWQYYGDSVTKAADTCDLDATPAGGNATTATGTTATGATATGASATSSGVSSCSKIGLESGKLILKQTASSTAGADESGANLNKPAAVVFGAAILAAAQLL